MTWQRYRLEIWRSPSAPNWCFFWDPLDSFQGLNQPELPDLASEEFQLQCWQHSDGWIDFFLGKAAMEKAVSRCSCIDSHRKIAEDLDRLRHLACPPGIPKSLWKLLQLRAKQKARSSRTI
jgi:hypothetical protein